MRQLTTTDLDMAGIPKRYWHVTFAEVPKAAPYREDLRKYVHDLPEMLRQGIGLYLYSTANGTGKTALAAIVAKHALRIKRSAYFISAGLLQDAVIRGEMVNEDTTVLEHVRQVSLLVIDDLGKEFDGRSGFSASLLEGIARKRVQDMRATIYTSNITPGNLQARYSTDLVEVVREAALTVHVVDESQGGVDWRTRSRNAITAQFDQ